MRDVTALNPTISHYAPNTILPRHRHSAARLCIVLSGAFEEEENRLNRVNRAGHLLYRPADMPHAERFGSSGARCVLISPSASWLNAARRSGIDLAVPAVIASPDVIRLGSTLRRECEYPDTFSSMACEAAAWECLVLFGRTAASADRIGFPALRRAEEFLRAHLAEPVGLSRVAKLAGTHPATLTRQFRLRHGKLVGAYLRQLRVERAAALLRETAMPIAEIAIACGFASQSHLTTLFRRSFGTTPARLRALLRA